MTAMTPDKVEAALGAELCVLNHCTELCEFHRRWASRLAAVITSALAEVERDAARYRFIADRACDVIMCASSTDYGDGDTTFGARVEVDPDQFPIKRYGHPKAKLDAAIDAAMKDTGCELSDAEIDATTDYRGHDPDYDRKDTDHAR